MFAFTTFAAGVICAGLYPAFVVSGFKPIAVLKGRFQSSTRGNYLRRGLVIIQFVSSIVLITGTLIVHNQVDFMRNSKLGIDVQEVLAVHGPPVRDSSFVARFTAFRNSLLEYRE